MKKFIQFLKKYKNINILKIKILKIKFKNITKI